MNKDVLTYCRRQHGQVYNADSQQWENKPATDKFYKAYFVAIKCSTEQEWIEACVKLRTLDTKCAAYLDQNWWPYKKRCVHAWTNTY